MVQLAQQARQEYVSTLLIRLTRGAAAGALRRTRVLIQALIF